MKCLIPVTLILATALLCSAELSAQAPQFNKEEFIKANGTPITLGLGHADPCVIDWDSDGIKDLLVGQYTSGKIRFYKNSGTNSNPVLTTHAFLQADGTDITLSYG